MPPWSYSMTQPLMPPTADAPNRSCLVMPPAPRERCSRNECETLQSYLIQNAARPPHAIRHRHELRGPAAPPRILQADHQQIHVCRLHRGSALGERSVGDSETCRVKGPSSPCKSPCSRGLILKAGTGPVYVSGQFEIRSPHRREPVARKRQGTFGAESPEAGPLTGAVHVGPDGSHASRLKHHSSGR